MISALRELMQYRELLRHLVVLDIKARYRGSVLGFLWTLLNPILLMAVLAVVFSRFARIDEASYPLFLLSALMTWNFVAQSIDQSLNTLIQNRGLFDKIYIPKLVFPISVVLSNLVNFSFSLVAYLVIAVIFHEVPLTFPLVIPLLVILLLLASGAAMVMSTVNVFFRDFSHLTSVLLRALFYLTPIIYPPELLGPGARPYLQANPAYYPVMIARDVMYRGQIPTLELWGVGLAVSVAVFLLGLRVFTSAQGRFIYYV